MHEQPEGVRVQDIMAALKFTTANAVGGTTAGLTKQAKRAGFIPDDIYTSRRDATGEFIYKIGPLMQEALADE